MPESSTYTYGQRTQLDLDKLVDRAIDLMKNEPDPLGAAATLFIRWTESDWEIKALLPDLFRPFLEQRIKERAKEPVKK